MSAQKSSLNWQLHLSHSRKKMEAFLKSCLFSLRLLVTFLYKEIKNGQRLERVWTDINTPMRRILRRKVR